MTTPKRRRGTPGGTGTSRSDQHDASETTGSSQADGSASAQDNDGNANAQTLTSTRTQRSRNNRSGSKSDGTQKRRGKNEPGQYQVRDEEPDVDDIGDDIGDDDANRTGGRGLAPRSMESAFDDEDMDAESLYEYSVDEADSDIDWDDSIPPRGGGKSPDR